MLDKLKGLGTQVVSKTGDAVEGIATSVKGHAESLANTAGGMTDSLNEKAVRASTAQVCSILELAIEELKGRPLANQRLTLTASVNVGIAALEMHVHLEPEVRSDGTLADPAAADPSSTTDASSVSQISPPADGV